MEPMRTLMPIAAKEGERALKRNLSERSVTEVLLPQI